MEALQSVKASWTALASQLISAIKEETDSITAMINHVKESVRERMERIDQKLAEEEMSRIKAERSASFQTSHHQSVEVCRRENNDEEEEESEFHDAMESLDYIQEDEHEIPDSKFQDMAKDDEAAGEDGAITRVAAVP